MNRRGFLRTALCGAAAAATVAFTNKADAETPRTLSFRDWFGAGGRIKSDTLLDGVSVTIPAIDPTTLDALPAYDHSLPPMTHYHPFPPYVTLERLWRIVNDPTYVNYGRHGNRADSVFPEYDDDRFRLNRLAEMDGHYRYYVMDMMTGDSRSFFDVNIRYASSTVADQEMAARALYAMHLNALRDPDAYGFRRDVWITGVQGQSFTKTAGNTYVVPSAWAQRDPVITAAVPVSPLSEAETARIRAYVQQKINAARRIGPR